MNAFTDQGRDTPVHADVFDRVCAGFRTWLALNAASKFDVLLLRPIGPGIPMDPWPRLRVQVTDDGTKIGGIDGERIYSFRTLLTQCPTTETRGDPSVPWDYVRGRPCVTVDSILEALAKAAPGADELHRSLAPMFRQSASNTVLD